MRDPARLPTEEKAYDDPGFLIRPIPGKVWLAMGIVVALLIAFCCVAYYELIFVGLPD
jgi:hypothetical protein